MGASWAALAAMLGLAYKSHRDTHQGLQEQISRKADIEDVERHERAIQGLADQQRRDKDQILSAISDLKDTVHQNHLELTRELGKR